MNEIRRTIEKINSDNKDNIISLHEAMADGQKNCFMSNYESIRRFGVVRYIRDVPWECEGISIYIIDSLTRRD